MTVQLLTLYTDPERHDTTLQTDRRHYDATRRSHCLTVRSAKKYNIKLVTDGS